MMCLLMKPLRNGRETHLVDVFQCFLVGDGVIHQTLQHVQGRLRFLASNALQLQYRGGGGEVSATAAAARGNSHAHTNLCLQLSQHLLHLQRVLALLFNLRVCNQPLLQRCCHRWPITGWRTGSGFLQQRKPNTAFV